MLHRLGRLEEAESLFRWLLVYDIRNVDFAIALGTIHQLRNEYDRAIAVFGMAYALSGGNARPLLLAARCNLAARRTHAARQCFQKLIDEGADPDLRAEAHSCLAELLGNAGPASGRGGG